MEREEFKAALNELNERQNEENRQNADRLFAIKSEYTDTMRKAEDKLRGGKKSEELRHKEAIMRIEFERQQLFADYKMKKNQ